MNKRDFIVGGSIALAAAATAATAAAAQPLAACRRRRLPPLDGVVRQSAWQRHVGQEFIAGALTLKLRRVDVAPRRPGLEQFTLVFDAVPPGAAAPDGLHCLRDAGGQTVALRLDAIAGAPAGCRALFCLSV